MSKRLLLRFFLVAFLGFLIFAGALSWNRPAHRITQASVDAMQLGMTLEEVAAIVGMPPGNYSAVSAFDDQRFREFWWSPFLVGRDREAGSVAHAWFARDGAILAIFDAEGRLVHKQYAVIEPDTFGERLHRWMGW